MGIALQGWIALAAGLAWGCAPSVEPVVGCESERGIVPVCGFQNPEDLAALPDGRRVIVSQAGAMDGSTAGNLGVFDRTTAQLRVAWASAADGRVEADPAPVWGDADCPGPPTPFTPHGIDLAPLGDGRLRLLVVNHGQRESLEFFEVFDDATVAWRGCAVPPEGAYLNDVLSGPGDELLTTHMLDRDAMLWQMVRATFGADTGWVYRWSPGGEFEVVDGTAGPFPNGLELSAGGREVIVNLYLRDEVRRISRETGEVLARAAIVKPDNVTWSAHGRLLVASHSGAGSADAIACNALPEGACPFGFDIWSLDPETLEGEIVFSNSGPPMGAGTVALDVGGELLIGSFAGDRIIRVAR